MMYHPFPLNANAFTLALPISIVCALGIQAPRRGGMQHSAGPGNHRPSPRQGPGECLIPPGCQQESTNG